MATHVWLFPWLALAAGLAALLVGSARSGLRARRIPSSAPPLPFLVIWILAAAAVFFFNRHAGTVSGVDVIPMRGILLGSLGGLLLVQICRLSIISDAAEPRPISLLPMLFGLGTILVASGRLWLTHGEQSGLTAMAVGVALAVFCLGIAPAVLSLSASESSAQVAFSATLGLLYLVCLAATTALGFTRADTISQMYWADIPLLLAGALCLGAAMGGDGTQKSSLMTTMPLITTPALGAGAGYFAARLLAHDGTVLKLLGMGALTFALLTLICRRERPDAQASGDLIPAPWDTNAMAGLLLVVLASTLAFAFWSGYGLGLMILGGWFAAPWALAPPAPNPGGEDGRAWHAWPLLAGFGFAAVLLLHRLLLLQNGHGMSTGGPADTWDLFAICFGAVLPLSLAAWTSQRPSGWPGLVEWLVAIILPSLLVGYVLGTRAVAGVVLGAALSQMLSGIIATDRTRLTASILNGLLMSLILLQFLPVMAQMDEPTRRIRSVILLAMALVIAARLLIPANLLKSRRLKLRGAR